MGNRRGKRVKVHYLKLDVKYFEEIKLGKKKFEIRKNDRDFKIRDVLKLIAYRNGHYVRWSKNKEKWVHTIKEKADTIKVKVTYIINYFETFKTVQPRYHIVDYCGKFRSGVDVPEYPKPPVEQMQEVLCGYFKVDCLPSSYVILGIEAYK